MIIMKKAVLFKARHSHPEIDGLQSIFSETINPMDFEKLDRVAMEFVATDSEFTVYVTGLTPATVSVVKACVTQCKKLTLMHYNRDTDSYVAQPVVTTMIVDYEDSLLGVTVPVGMN